MGSRKRIFVLTGIQSEYDVRYSVLRAIDEHPRPEQLLSKRRTF